MKFDVGIIFLVAAAVSLAYVIQQLYYGAQYDFSFWLAVMWIFLGPYFYKTLGKPKAKE